ncbi:MAG: hypothetical protein JNN17_13375 [Verrucomicrobiaceae bacterium]|nr:hypothetical protein [Verrucomicrobiaceae bacterium]
MKTTLLALFALTTASLANPEIANIITQEYGVAVTEGILLLQAPASAGEPVKWTVYARDPFRRGELLRSEISQQNSSWSVRPAGAGDNLLRATPPATLAFNRVKVRSPEARSIASRAAVESKTTFATIEYQLACNNPAAAPEWGLALLNNAGMEVGFILINAETGAITHQQWASQVGLLRPGEAPQTGDKGARAAQDVKDAARRAWHWTDDARKETKSFFKELFRRD